VTRHACVADVRENVVLDQRGIDRRAAALEQCEEAIRSAATQQGEVFARRVPLAGAVGEMDALEQALRVLDAGLAGPRRFARTDPSRKMPCDPEILCPGLLENREIGFARHAIVDLEE